MGDVVDRVGDMVSEEWLQDENQRVQDEADAENGRVSELRNSQLEALTEQRYQVNQEWADSQEDYDTPDSRIVEIHDGADIGRVVHEGNG